MISGTQGYAEQAAELPKRYESVLFASQGCSVVAVEPTDELREPGKALHPSPLIEWLKDSLPDLALVLARDQRFDVVVLSAVWMHLDEEERRIAMPKLSSLIAPGGVMVMSLRHGPVPPGRRMFDVSAEETVALAAANGLGTVLCARTESAQASNRTQNVTWTRLAFRYQS